jgi:hypothetical protein
MARIREAYEQLDAAGAAVTLRERRLGAFEA